MEKKMKRTNLVLEEKYHTLKAYMTILIFLSITLFISLIIIIPISTSQINNQNNIIYCGSEDINFNRVYEKNSDIIILGHKCCVNDDEIEFFNYTTGEYNIDKNSKCIFKRANIWGELDYYWINKGD